MFAQLKIRKIFGRKSESLYFCAKLYKPMTMKTIKRLLLLFVAMMSVSMVRAQVINGDFNHNGKIDLSDVTQLINNYLTGTSEEISGTDNNRIVGTWYKSEKESITFSADGMTDYVKGYTYQYLPQGFILFYDANGLFVHVMRVVKVTADSIVLLSMGSDTPVSYTASSQTESDSGYDNGYEYVDLGLPSGTKWATMNVGANAPEEYGDFFAWGETTPQKAYSWATYKYCNGTYKTLTKYNTNRNWGGFIDGKIVLEISDDAARVNWGGTWRIPTIEELTELYEGCDWTWTILNGKTGYNVTSKVNGNAIFFPAEGYVFNGASGNIGTYGYYWSSSLNPESPSDCKFLKFGENEIILGNSTRCSGRTIRAVCE